MTILVTGATGFIGNYVIKELLEKTDYRIIATSRFINNAKTYSWYDKVQYIEYDFQEKEEKNLFSFFNKPDALIHLGWEHVSDCQNLSHIESSLFIHYYFIKNLIANGLKSMTISGTCLEYGVNGCLDEKQCTKPTSSYGIAKDTLRRFIEKLQNEYDFSYRWARLFFMYGDGQSERSLLSLVDKAIRNSDTTFNMSGGEQLRDYMHVSDVAKDIVFLSTLKNYSGIVNCCSGKAISIRRLVEEYLQRVDYKLELNLGYYPYVDYEPMAFWGNNSKIKQLKQQNRQNK